MLIRISSAILLLALGAGGQAYGAEPAPLAMTAAEKCEVTLQDLERLREVSFDQMDQRGDADKSARKLFEAKCPSTAASVEADYLVHNAVSDDQRRIMMFHIGQGAALAGQEQAAALIIAGTKFQVQPSIVTLDWNSYVDGIYAFLVKDRALLEKSHTILVEKGGNNALNASVLERMIRCFTKPYAALDDEACKPAPIVPDRR